ncbi:cysteine protease [Prosthecochloris sp. N3]|uniref:Cysteine protease n=1 Tax=Prosthecochloris ethylica TaxID=2743976 RepID=A0ABR9XTI8_9CHLB|nr:MULTISPECIES: C1 family peptidase [Prosthecochloris]MEC9486873.1 C1 family peptidase [Prosthecochloris sp.]MBF0585919.1 cysteine protease [Prosthecochloris ethylica]MBF0637076.1 cysteine protease [Prosthecochloris ethylica]NUK47313.1 cysteine protease [Prosthecochloris ethylica]RNA64103.1 cysteine protease [Prosthecochloris sp. ZM_2]
MLSAPVAVRGHGLSGTGTGWLHPLPDLRDYTERTPVIADMFRKLKIGPTGKVSAKDLPESVDLREWCSPVEEQGEIGSCTAHAVLGAVEYYQKRAFGTHIDGSRRFVYKTTRNLMGTSGDSGAWLRSAMGALALCGVPHEKYWEYTDSDPEYDEEPPAFVYAVADNFEALKYFCHDPAGSGVSRKEVLRSVKTSLAGGIVSMFGFYGFPSFGDGGGKGDIPYPCDSEQAGWGHALVAVGYDDRRKVKNTRCGQTAKGALLVRNSWGAGWGDNGYGWLPYDYVLQGLAVDFWSLLSLEWVDTGQFGF